MTAHDFESPKNCSPLWRKAVVALKELVKVEGEGKASTAFAQAVAESRRRALTSGGWKEVKPGSREWNKFHRDHFGGNGFRLPGDDHESLWRKEGEFRRVSQPYHLSTEDAANMVAAAEEHGMSFTISPGGSWYFPGATMLVGWRTKE